MRREDSNDSDIERVLRGHFRAEAPGLRISRDPWTWLERRLDPYYVPASAGGWLGFRLGRVRLSPRAMGTLAFAGCVVAFVVSLIWVSSDSTNLGARPEVDFASAQPDYWSLWDDAASSELTDVSPAEPAMSAADISAAAEGEAEAIAITETTADELDLTSVVIAGTTVGDSDMNEGEVEWDPATAAEGEAEALATAVAAAPDVTSKSETVQPADTTFQDTTRQRSVSTWEDNVSTFSLDTDRTSYHLALNWARSGYEVDPDSVRAEEWINAFDYQYEPPLRDDSFAISTDVIAHPIDGGMHLARIAFQAPVLTDDIPVNVTLVLDASGSMSDGDRVSIAREAAESIRLSLRDQDRIAVVHFTKAIIDDLTVEHSDPDSREVRRSIQRLEPHNSTNVQAGLDLGVRLADRARRERPNAYNYIILMSDGVANVDATDPFAILESVGENDRQNPLRLITIGVGIENYNDYLLEQLAQHGNGWYRYLSTEDQARATFARDNWLALSAPFADQTRAQVTWDADAVETWRLIGYENRVTSDQSFTQARKEFAEIPAGAATTVFYELELTDRGTWTGAKLGDVEVRWVTPLTGDANRQHAAIQGQQGFRADALDDALLDFGAIVALTSDLYSALPYAGYPDAQVERGLTLLRDELQHLEGSLGDLPAFRDFKFLMQHITRNFADSSEPTGYSQ